MADLQLFVAVLGDSSAPERVLCVRAPNSTAVAEFKEMIYAKAPH